MFASNSTERPYLRYTDIAREEMVLVVPDGHPLLEKARPREGYSCLLYTSQGRLMGSQTICQLKYSSSGLVIHTTWVTISPCSSRPLLFR